MITIFACPKPLTDPHISVIQRNAIQSWRELDPEIQVILFGEEAGIGELARELSCEHVPTVRRNEFGTPLLNDVFNKAQIVARHDLLCYINADIILMKDYLIAVRTALLSRRSFLLGGRPVNLDIRAPLDFAPGWEEALHEAAHRVGTLRPLASCDYFVFRKNLWSELPPFAIGRCHFDNALLYLARRSGARLINATGVVDAIHQNHSYPAGLGGLDYLTNPEASNNIELAGGNGKLYTWRNATHIIRGGQVRRVWSSALVRCGHIWLHDLWWPFLRVTRPVRHRLGLRASVREV